MSIDLNDGGIGAGPGRIKRRLRNLAWIIFIYLAFSILLPLHSFDFRHIRPIVHLLMVVVPTAIFMLLQISLSLAIVRLNLKPFISVILAIINLIAWFGVLFYFHLHHRVSYDYLLVFHLIRYSLLGLLLTLTITFFGSLLSLIIKERNLLLPVALIAMPIDYLGAMTPTGFTHDMVVHASNIVSSVSVGVPAISASGLSISPIAFIGPGDVLFMAMFFAAVQRFQLAERATFWWMYGLLTISMILAIILFPVAALVPMGIAVIIANASQVKLKRDEVFAVIYAGAFIIVLVSVFYWSSHKYLFHAH